MRQFPSSSPTEKLEAMFSHSPTVPILGKNHPRALIFVNDVVHYNLLRNTILTWSLRCLCSVRGSASTTFKGPRLSRVGHRGSLVVIHAVLSLFLECALREQSPTYYCQPSVSGITPNQTVSQQTPAWSATPQELPCPPTVGSSGRAPASVGLRGSLAPKSNAGHPDLKAR
ncbi:hypothetical protein BKA82DRAFT_306344 [Pisolithus tinctorius]|uniref:Uncharacterized protein n=1 Tax=Pisolithus tinctorius Marx 270 TaxID=870435 RepID=A0A0C3JIZ4_PISTI|nr:hypothetical protein BKA82DRAFT_306344 [Pisolithus tinctorius]KIO09083.1 hypothetical protein M404DRAFT_306344 [Pisolithus tinctorius Marx 270]